MKEAIQRDKVVRAVWVCTDENMGICRDLEPWAKVWGCMGVQHVQDEGMGMCGQVWGMHSHGQMGGTRLGFDDIRV